MSEDPYIGKIVRSLDRFAYCFDNIRNVYEAKSKAMVYSRDSLFYVLTAKEKAPIPNEPEYHYILKPLVVDSDGKNINKSPVWAPFAFFVGFENNNKNFEIIDEDQ